MIVVQTDCDWNVVKLPYCTDSCIMLWEMCYGLCIYIVALVRVRRTAAPGFRQVAWVGAAILSNSYISEMRQLPS